MNNDLIGSILRADTLVPLLIFSGIILVVLIQTAGSVVRSVSKERTRREIAAYIAEGTMTPEQGERLMRSGERKDAC